MSTSNRLYVCAGTYLLGGYNILPDNAYFTRVYTGLPPHNEFFYSITFWLIDSWNPPDSFTIEFDSVSVQGFNGLQHSTNFPNDYLCGNTFRDLKDVFVSGLISHSTPSLTLKVTSKTDQVPTDESFGFRDINLIFKNNTVTANTFCAVASITLPNKQCQCSVSQYLDTSGGCQNCDSSCEFCFGPSSLECSTCKTEYFYNGTGCQACYSACSDCFGASDSQCLACKTGFAYSASSYACFTSGCPAGEFAFPDGTCQISCISPLSPNLNNGVLSCSFLCNSEILFYSEQYLP